MLLLSRPPYVRWIAAGLVLAIALGLEVADRSVEPYPFASRPIARGEELAADAVEWRDLPSGTFTAPSLTGRVATAAIGVGDPITSSVVGPVPSVAQGWWAVPVDLPIGVPLGARVRLILEGGSAFEGIVVGESTEDGFGVPTMGSVALPAEHADLVARAAAENRVAVAVAP